MKVNEGPWVNVTSGVATPQSDYDERGLLKEEITELKLYLVTFGMNECEVDFYSDPASQMASSSSAKDASAERLRELASSKKGLEGFDLAGSARKDGSVAGGGSSSEDPARSIEREVRERKDREREEAFTQAFSQLDADRDGLLTPHELAVALMTLNPEVFKDIGQASGEASHVIENYDTSGRGGINLADFIRLSLDHHKEITATDKFNLDLIKEAELSVAAIPPS